MKNFVNKIIAIFWLFSLWIYKVNAAINISIWNNHDYFDNLKNEEKFINIWNNPYNFAINVADSLINIFFIIAIIYFFILVIKLLVSNDAEEEHENFKKWFLWISIWLMVMQMAKVYVKSIHLNHNIWEKPTSELYLNSANSILDNIVKPLTWLLEFWASFLFIMIAIYAFYKLISSNWNEDAAKEWKNMIIYSIGWFILIKVASTLIRSVYWTCDIWKLNLVFNTTTCNHNTNLPWVIWIVTNIINWLNSFIWVWIILMIIFAWLKLMFSKWDEEKINSWKKSLIYIFIWVWILVTNYFILTFFLNVPKT